MDRRRRLVDRRDLQGHQAHRKVCCPVSMGHHHRRTLALWRPGRLLWATRAIRPISMGRRVRPAHHLVTMDRHPLAKRSLRIRHTSRLQVRLPAVIPVSRCPVHRAPSRSALRAQMLDHHRRLPATVRRPAKRLRRHSSNKRRPISSNSSRRAIPMAPIHHSRRRRRPAQ